MNNLSYKKKFIGIAILIPVLIMLSLYRFLFPTIQLKNECVSMEEELDSTRAENGELITIRNEMDALHVLIGDEKASLEEINRGIVDFIADESSSLHIQLTRFPPVHVYESNQFRIFTHEAEIEGRFSSILLLTHHMEKEFKMAKIASVRFYTREDHYSKKKQLYGSIYIQNIQRMY